MSDGNRRKIIGLLGVGFDAEDGHVRITRGERFDVLMGSDESHAYIHQLIQEIESELDRRGWVLDELTPSEFSELVESLQNNQ